MIAAACSVVLGMAVYIFHIPIPSLIQEPEPDRASMLSTRLASEVGQYIYISFQNDTLT